MIIWEQHLHISVSTLNNEWVLNSARFYFSKINEVILETHTCLISSSLNWSNGLKPLFVPALFICTIVFVWKMKEV